MSDPLATSLSLEEAKKQYGIEWTRTAARAALWARGDLSYLTHSGQRDLLAAFRTNRAVIHVWNIGRRYGKSTGACYLAFEEALRTPNQTILFVSSTWSSLEENVIPIMGEIIAQAPEQFRPRIVGNKVLFKNGSHIELAGCEDRKKADALRGRKAKLVIIDEAAFIPVLDYVVSSVLLPPLINTDGKLLIASTPPVSPTHPFVTFLKQADLEGAYQHRTVEDAPHLTPEMIERLVGPTGGRDSSKWRREYMAELVIDEVLALVPEFTWHEEQIVVDDYDIPFEHDRYTVGDIGFHPDLTAFVFASWDFKNAILYIHDEYFAHSTTSAEIQRSIRQIEAEAWPDPLAPWARHYRWIDAQAITRADISTHASGIHNYQQVNTREPEAAVNSLRVNIQPKIRINSKCKTLIAHVKHGVWDDTRTRFARAEGFGHFDGVAALMYLNRHCDWSHNPVTPQYVDQARQYTSNPQPYYLSEDHRQQHQLTQLFRKSRKRV